MTIHIKMSFSQTKNAVTCKLRIDGKFFICTKRIQPQADRISSLKRAKQLAYLGAMIKVHGYVCERKI